MTLAAVDGTVGNDGAVSARVGSSAACIRGGIADAVGRAVGRLTGNACVGIALGGLLVSAPIRAAGLFPAEIELSSLLIGNGGDGSTGFVLYGIDPGDAAGVSVSDAGDVNGDGLDDVIIGAFFGANEVGQALVVFGDPHRFPAEFELSSLLSANGGDGSRGFAVNGVHQSDSTGYTVSRVGDVNGDGLDDVMIGADAADPPSGMSAGRCYVVFGRSTGFPAEIELETLLPEFGGDGSMGFVIDGVNGNDRTSSTGAAGDINGDGIDDLVVGARTAEVGDSYAAGRSFVLFGSSEGFAAAIELASLLPANGGDGSDGFVLNGIYEGGQSGRSVSGAGDLNGDGFDDLIVGAYAADPTGQNSGQSYVIFGRSEPFPAALPLKQLLPENGGDGSQGFVIDGAVFEEDAGWSVSDAGDVNRDGIDDVIIGAPTTRTNEPATGAAHVVFGTRSGFPAEFELRRLVAAYGGDGSKGFVLEGIDSFDRAGTCVSNAGDVNGDAIDDVLVSADFADPGGREKAGETYLIFGSEAGFAAEFELQSLLPDNGGDGSRGVVFNGIDFQDVAGTCVSAAGDMNVDGVADLMIGAPFGDPHDKDLAGEVYVVFGRQDSDGDGISDATDNCALLVNADQRDTNKDGFGNICDPDLNDDHIVNFLDLGLLKAAFLSGTPDADFNGDGIVNFVDVGTTKAFFFLPPGPSGLAPN